MIRSYGGAASYKQFVGLWPNIGGSVTEAGGFLF